MVVKLNSEENLENKIVRVKIENVDKEELVAKNICI